MLFIGAHATLYKDMDTVALASAALRHQSARMEEQDSAFNAGAAHSAAVRS